MIDKIEADLKKALLAREELTVSVLKLVKNALANKRIELGKDLSDEEIVKVIRTEAKKRTEAAEMYEKGGNQAGADKEKAELKIIEGYLPSQMDDAELKKLIEEIKTELGDVHPGQIIQETIKRADGRADGGRISKEIMQK